LRRRPGSDIERLSADFRAEKPIERTQYGDKEAPPLAFEPF